MGWRFRKRLRIIPGFLWVNLSKKSGGKFAGPKTNEKQDKKLEHFWDGLSVRKTDQDRELQRKVVLGADAIVATAALGFWKGIKIVLLVLGVFLFIIMWSGAGVENEQREKAKAESEQLAKPAQTVSFLSDLRDAKSRPSRPKTR